MNRIEVFIASDKAYYSGLFVAIESCIRNSSQNLGFTLIMNEKDSRTEPFLERVRSSPKVDTVRVIQSDSIDGLKHYKGKAHFSKMAFARLLMEELYAGQDVDHVLYLDPDIIVHVDVAELWEKRGEYPLMMSDQNNSGVLLMDIGYWRENNLDSECVRIWREKGEGFRHPDQDLLIHLFNDQGRCGYFEHVKWNLGSGYWDGESDSIIHCIGGRKPWHEDYKYPLVKQLFIEYYEAVFGKGSFKTKGALLSSLTRRWNNLKIKLGLK